MTARQDTVLQSEKMAKVKEGKMEEVKQGDIGGDTTCCGCCKKKKRIERPPVVPEPKLEEKVLPPPPVETPKVEESAPAAPIPPKEQPVVIDEQVDNTQMATERTQLIRPSMMTSALSRFPRFGVEVGENADQISLALTSIRKEREVMYNTNVDASAYRRQKIEEMINQNAGRSMNYK